MKQLIGLSLLMIMASCNSCDYKAQTIDKSNTSISQEDELYPDTTHFKVIEDGDTVDMVMTEYRAKQ